MRTQIVLTAFEESYFPLVPRFVGPAAVGKVIDGNPNAVREPAGTLAGQQKLGVLSWPAGTVTVTYQARPLPVSA